MYYAYSLSRSSKSNKQSNEDSCQSFRCLVLLPCDSIDNLIYFDLTCLTEYSMHRFKRIGKEMQSNAHIRTKILTKDSNHCEKRGKKIDCDFELDNRNCASQLKVFNI